MQAITELQGLLQVPQFYTKFTAAVKKIIKPSTRRSSFLSSAPAGNFELVRQAKLSNRAQFRAKQGTQGQVLENPFRFTIKHHETVHKFALLFTIKTTIESVINSQKNPEHQWFLILNKPLAQDSQNTLLFALAISRVNDNIVIEFTQPHKMKVIAFDSTQPEPVYPEVMLRLYPKIPIYTYSRPVGSYELDLDPDDFIRKKIMASPDFDIWFVVTPFIEGQSLQKFLTTPKFIFQSRNLFPTLAAKLAHEATLITLQLFSHRDLKPGNYLITEDCRVMVIDAEQPAYYTSGQQRNAGGITLGFASPQSGTQNADFCLSPSSAPETVQRLCKEPEYTEQSLHMIHRLTSTTARIEELYSALYATTYSNVREHGVSPQKFNEVAVVLELPDLKSDVFCLGMILLEMFILCFFHFPFRAFIADVRSTSGANWNVFIDLDADITRRKSFIPALIQKVRQFPTHVSTEAIQWRNYVFTMLTQNKTERPNMLQVFEFFDAQVSKKGIITYDYPQATVL
jgi:serine/threonine protein kinase